MINGHAAERIKSELKSLLKDDGLTLEYAHLRTGLSIEGIRKAASVTNQFRPSTAKKLARFIEEETDGAVKATDLLNPKRMDYRNRNLENADFSGMDLTGADFSDALLNGANFSGATLRRVKFLGAFLREADFTGCAMTGMDARCVDFSGAHFKDASIKGCRFESSVAHGVVLDCVYVYDSWFNAADLTDAKIKDVTWYTWGSVCRGIVFPDFDPKEMARCYQFNEAVSHLLMREYPDSFEIRQICEFINSRMFFRCWDDFVERMLRYHESRIIDLELAFQKYPKWLVYDRWKLALFMRNFETLDDYRYLRETPFYSVFGNLIDKEIRKKEREFELIHQKSERALVLAD